jgi:hypothetical protein
MKKLFILVAVIAVAIVIWLVQRAVKQAQDRTRSSLAATTGQPSATATAASASLAQLGGSISNTYPRWEGGRSTSLNDPRWEIYRQRQKSDPNWQWKMPIEFYGKVVDERNQTIGGAKTTFVWNDLSNEGSSQSETQSDENGLFSLQNVTGKILSVTVEKSGYYSSKMDPYGFDYAAFWEENFYQPNPSDPVVFHLRKKGEAEPLVFRQTLYGLKPDGTPQYIDLGTGKKVTGGRPVGDIMIRLYRSPSGDPNKFDWTLTLQGVGAAGLVESHDEFMFEAPDSGYENTIQIKEHVGDPDYQRQITANYYIRLSDGKTYARIEAEIRPKYNDQGAVDLALYLNPSGSRNLEFDPEKAINP